MRKHQTQALTTIAAMSGPAEGQLRVQLEAVWDVSQTVIVTAEEAVTMVKNHPKIEFHPVEQWKLD